MKEMVENLHLKLKTVEQITMTSEDRLKQIEKVIEEEKVEQHKLTEMVARLLTKKHNEATQLEEARATAKNLETENSVCRCFFNELSLINFTEIFSFPQKIQRARTECVRKEFN